MTNDEPAQPIRYCLVCNDEAVESDVRTGCPPPHAISTFPMDGIVSESMELSEHGRRIVACARSASAVLVAWRFDLAPVINTLCFHVRRELLAPVVALVGSNPEESIQAIAAGADAAMPFPLHAPLLDAQVFAYRRLADAARQIGIDSPGGAGTVNPDEAPWPDVLEFGPLALDRTAHRFYAAGQEAELTPREFALLEYLIRRREQVLPRDEILKAVWGINFDTGTNMVDVYMYFLRRKLEAHGVRKMIQTVRGRGYRLVLPA